MPTPCPRTPPRATARRPPGRPARPGSPARRARPRTREAWRGPVLHKLPERGGVRRRGGPREQVHPFEDPQRRHRHSVGRAIQPPQQFVVGQRRRERWLPQVNPSPRGLDLEPVQLRNQRDASPGEHPLSWPRRACQQPGLEGKQVTDEHSVLPQPPVKCQICNRALTHRIKKRMPGSGGPQRIKHAPKNSHAVVD